MPDEVKIGIDLGTTYCAVAAIDGEGRPFIVKNEFGALTTPSVVGVADGAEVVGDAAKDLQGIGSADVAAFFKRSMGQDGFDFELGGRAYTPTELSARMLRHLVRDAEARLGAQVAGAVVTVPAYYAGAQRAAVQEACRQAGVSLLGLLNEPSAAAYAYGLHEDGDGQTLLVYDLGGGTFDVTAARVFDDEIRVLGIDGDHSLGGKDFDDVLAQLMVDLLFQQQGLDSDAADLDAGDYGRLAIAAEQAKRQLSSRESVRVPLAVAGASGVVEVRRVDFEAVSAHLVRRTIDVVDRLLAELGLALGDIDAVVPVGGSTRIPMVRAALESKFHRAPCGGVNPDEAVALGAAVRANLPPRCLLPGDAAAPDLRMPGDAAAPQLVLRGAKRLVDVTAHAMGMVAEAPDRSRYVNSEIIPRNAPIPAAARRTYALRVPPEGGELEVYVLQGSHDRVLDNDVHGKYVVSGIEREPGGESLVEVEYRYTSDAISRWRRASRVRGRCCGCCRRSWRPTCRASTACRPS